VLDIEEPGWGGGGGALDFLLTKSSADLKMVVTSETLRMRSAGIGSVRGAGAYKAAGVFSWDATLLVGRPKLENFDLVGRFVDVIRVLNYR